MMMSVLSWIVTAVVSLAASLAALAQTPATDPATLAALLSKADEQLCQAVADRNVERFVSLIAENATFSGGADMDERGREAVRKAWAPYFEPGGATLTWRPDKAEVLPGGDVGYTIGRYERKSRDTDGRVVTQRGNYVTVWRKHPDGAWRVVYDTGSPVGSTTENMKPEQVSIHDAHEGHKANFGTAAGHGRAGESRGAFPAVPWLRAAAVARR